MQRQGLGADFSLEVIEERPGILVFVASGKGTRELFSRESGGHRWQRVPPTEKRGRVQTSTVTVAAFDMMVQTPDHQIDRRDIEIRTTRGSGPGGQHKNTSDTAVVATHIPTGITARC